VGDQLVGLKLASRSRRVLAKAGDVASPLARSSGGRVSFVRSDGDLVSIDGAGRETAHASLWTGSAGAPARSATLLTVGAHSSVVVAAFGRGVGFLGRLGVVDWLENPRCSDVVGLAPRGLAQVVVACHSGLIVLVGEEPPE
jgi:hypothetical protein